MSKTKLWITGVASFLPIVLIPIAIMILVLSSLMNGQYQQDYSEPNAGLSFIIVLTMIFSIIIIGGSATAIKIYFIYDTFNNPYVKKENRLTWLVLLSLFSVVVSPFYWGFNLFRHRNEEDIQSGSLPNQVI